MSGARAFRKYWDDLANPNSQLGEELRKVGEGGLEKRRGICKAN